MEPRAHIYGLDFSGAQNAASHIWIARGVLHDRTLHILDCQSAQMLFGKLRRDATLAALREMFARSGDALWGCDFPFSLHRSQLHADNWLDFALHFGERFATSEAFYAALGGKGNELRRQTDHDTGTPMPATNLRLYRQTYYGIRDLLAPLAAQEQAKVYPMQAAEARKPLLIEVCPAITLRRLGLRLPRYKENNVASWEQRAQILAGIEAQGISFASDDLRQRILANARGDALDSVIATLAAAEAQQGGALEADGSHIYRLEGMVFS